MKLISMTDFVIKYNMEFANGEISIEELQFKILRYAEFLKQPLKLSMFVPCDDEGNPISKPKKQDYTEEDLACSVLGVDMVNYLEAKEKVLFEGFKARITKNGFKAIKEGLELSVSADSKIIVEDLVYDGIILTESAIKQIGL